MKIMYDYQILWLQQYGGISRYFCELIHELVKYPMSAQIEIPVIAAQNSYFRELLGYKEWTNKRWERIANEICTVYKIITSYMKKKPYEIIHLTFYLPLIFTWFINYRKTKVVVTVYDMIHEKYMPDEKRLIRNKRKWIERADGIIAISECTKQDLLQYYPCVKEEKIEVIYLGSNSNIRLAQLTLPNKYILFVGNRAGYKNFEIFLQPEIRQVLKNNGLTLLCVGGGGFTSEEQLAINKAGMDNCVKQLTASDEELAYMYTKAECLVFPSQYEGFGIPVLEAFSWECPAVLSDTQCFREIAGNAALYFDAGSGASLALCLEQLLLDKDKKQSLAELGKDRLMHFSWKKTSEKTLQFYQKILSE